MVQFMTLPLFFFMHVLLSETLCSLTLEAEAGTIVRIWCQHDLTVTSFIFWVKHTCDSVPLRLACKQFRTSAPSEKCYFFTESERIVMSVHNKNTSLTIIAVNVSDTGLYYCGFGDKMIFSNSTSLQVKDGSQADKISDRAKAPDTPAVFFVLTVVVGVVIVILLSVLIFIIQKYRKRHSGDNTIRHDEEPDSVNYAALHISRKNIRKTGRHSEVVDPHVVYSAIRE